MQYYSQHLYEHILILMSVDQCVSEFEVYVNW